MSASTVLITIASTITRTPFNIRTSHLAIPAEIIPTKTLVAILNDDKQHLIIRSIIHKLLNLRKKHVLG